jgi:peroxiredoxin
MKRLAILSLIIFSQFAVFSQAIESFSLLNAVDNTSFSLSTYKADKAIVLIFFSGKCAYVDHYMERVTLIIDQFSARGVKFILVNSNSSDYVSEESIDEMKKFADRNNLNIPYLADKDKVLKKMLMATRTPEAFVLKPTQNQFQVVYKGAIDDNPQSAGDVSHAYLKDTLFNLLKNSKVELNQTRPVGCLIK